MILEQICYRVTPLDRPRRRLEDRRQQGAHIECRKEIDESVSLFRKLRFCIFGSDARPPKNRRRFGFFTAIAIGSSKKVMIIIYRSSSTSSNGRQHNGSSDWSPIITKIKDKGETKTKQTRKKQTKKKTRSTSTDRFRVSVLCTVTLS